MNCERANESTMRYVMRNLIIHKIYLSLHYDYLIVRSDVLAQLRAIFSIIVITVYTINFD